MKVCSNCGTPVPLAICPHCASTHALRGVAVGAVLLSLTACPDEDDTGEVQALYGAVIVDTADTAGCDTGGVEALYGVSSVDNDGDGHTEDNDCDDNDPRIHPAAEETAGDGVDSDCDCDDDS
jgi:hypothetical protein